MIYTDHKPLTFALSTKSDKYNPRDYRYLDYISQFTSDIRHIKGKDNIAADTLSRASLCGSLQNTLDMENIADEQVREITLLDSLRDSSLHIEHHSLPFSNKLIACDTSLCNPRPIVPTNMTNIRPFSFVVPPWS